MILAVRREEVPSRVVGRGLLAPEKQPRGLYRSVGALHLEETLRAPVLDQAGALHLPHFRLAPLGVVSQRGSPIAFRRAGGGGQSHEYR